MSLKNLMEAKKLNFTQPLLSVRRVPPTTESSKAEVKRKIDNSIPKIPPLPFYKSELKTGPVGHPGSVPFQWEHTPGRPKDENNSQTHGAERPPIAPKLPPGRILNAKQHASEKRNTLSRLQNVSTLDKNQTKHENSNDVLEDYWSSESEDDDETYMDALDTLSRTESSFVNCSVSDVSGLDGPDVKPTGNFSTDPQTRDFMMGRFLPAAKAMASETPQYASTWKQPIVKEQSRQGKKVVSSVDNHHLFYQYDPNGLSQCDKRAEESEDEDFQYGEPEISSMKICGLLPSFCLKNSFLNPVPGMRMQTRAHASSVRSVRTKTRNTVSSNGHENEHARAAIYEPRHIGGLQQDNVELKNESSKNAYVKNCENPDGSSLYRRLQGNDLSPYQNELSQSLCPEEKKLTGLPENPNGSMKNDIDCQRKGYKNFRELLASDRTLTEADSGSPVVEKTVYIDTVHMVQSRISNSSCSDTKGLSDLKGDDIEVPVKSIEPLNVVDEKELSCFQSSADRSSHYRQMGTIRYSRPDQNLIDDSNTLKIIKVGGSEKIGLENQWHAGSYDQERANEKLHLPLPPPLPKSPSDSWLLRALPAISSRAQSSWSTKTQPSKTQSVDPHWEMIVKSSNPHHGHLRFSEELLTPIPEV